MSTPHVPTRDAGAPTRPERDRRRCRRTKVFLVGKLLVGDNAARAHLLDLSPTGSRLHTDVDPALGSHVQLRLNDEDLLGEIVWNKSGKVGLRFSTALTPEQIEALISL